MLVLFISSLFAVFLTYLDSTHLLKSGMKYGFLIATFIYGIHYDYGSDYLGYFDIYKEIINNYTINDILNQEVIRNNEYGWGLLNLLFKPFGDSGFFILVALIGIIQSVVYYDLIINYVPKKLWPFAIFVFLFTNSLYPISFSGLRQLLAVAITTYAFHYSIKNENTIKSLLISISLILVVSTIHSSAIIMLPFMLIRFVSVKDTQYLSIIFAILFFVLYLFKDSIFAFYDYIMSFNKKGLYFNYETSVINDGLSLGIGFLLNTIPFVMLLLYLYKNQGISEQEKKVVSISCFGSLVIPFQIIAPLISRIAYYYIAFSVVAIPITYGMVKNKPIRLVITAVYVLFTLYQYYGFFHYDFWIHRYLKFHSLFELL